MVALAHGTNDAQKTMGVISLALIANGNLAGGDELRRAGLGRLLAARRRSRSAPTRGGWRIIKTLGTKVTEVRPPQGFSSEEVAATVILASSHVGYPLSTTHVVSGAVTGSGVGRPGAQVDWTVARRIVTGWLLTLPAAGLTAAVVFWITDLLGGGAVGPIAVTVILAIACFALWRANKASQVDPDDRSHRAGPPEPSRDSDPRAGGRMSLLADERSSTGARCSTWRSGSRPSPGSRSPPCSAWASCPRCARRNAEGMTRARRSTP